MYRILFGLAFVFLFTACNNSAQNSDNKNLLSTSLVKNPQTAGGDKTVDKNSLPVLEIKDTLHDFGAVTVGETVTHEFPFTNTGKGALIITNATAGCGCTVTDYPHDPIPPGKGGILNVKFNTTGKSGHQEKMVTISSNAANGTKIISILAEVKTEAINK